MLRSHSRVPRIIGFLILLAHAALIVNILAQELVIAKDIVTTL